MGEFTLDPKTETPENRDKRLFLIAMESLEKYAASAGFNLKDALPIEVIRWWQDYRGTLTLARRAERAEKSQREETARALEKAQAAVKSSLNPKELLAYERATRAST